MLTIEPNKKLVGSRIRSIRLKRGKTAEDFGKLVDKENPVSQSLVSRWERGVNLPNKERLAAIADLGNMTVDSLLYGPETLGIDKDNVKENLEQILIILDKHLYMNEKIDVISKTNNQTNLKILKNYLKVSNVFLELIENLVNSIDIILERDEQLALIDKESEKVNKILEEYEQQIENFKDEQIEDKEN